METIVDLERIENIHIVLFAIEYRNNQSSSLKGLRASSSSSSRSSANGLSSSAGSFGAEVFLTTPLEEDESAAPDGAEARMDESPAPDGAEARDVSPTPDGAPEARVEVGDVLVFGGVAGRRVVGLLWEGAGSTPETLDGDGLRCFCLFKARVATFDAEIEEEDDTGGFDAVEADAALAPPEVE